MIVSWSWLAELLDSSLPEPVETARILTDLGLEVEKIVPLRRRIAVLRSALVTTVEPGEKGSWLHLHWADPDNCLEHNAEVFCTDTTVGAQEWILYAPNGTLLGETEISEKMFADRLSSGMALSLFEAGLGGTAGIVHRTEGTQLDRLIAELGDETLLILGITPNRGDCLSHIGVARELAAALALPLPELGKGRIPIVAQSQLVSGTITVTLPDPKLDGGCPRYGLLELEGNTVSGPNVQRIQQRIGICGQRSISPLVDLTNYLLLESGQPTHAFDQDKVETVTVRRARAEETINLLDGASYELMQTDLVIDCNGHAGALAGVMGGSADSLSDASTKYAIESAWFDPISVRRSRTRLGISTEASYRFERHVDPALALPALLRFAWLAEQWLGLKPGALTWIETQPPKPHTILFTPEAASGLLGRPLSDAQAADALIALGCTGMTAASPWQITVPSWRPDVEGSADLTEEIARQIGFDAIPEILPVLTMAPGSRHNALPEQILALLIELGCYETVTYDFYSPADDEWLQGERAISLANPLGRDLSVMRRSLLPNLLKGISYNLSRQEQAIWLCEHGRSFMHANGVPQETEWIVVAGSGDLGRAEWNRSEALPGGWIRAKSMIVEVIAQLGLTLNQHQVHSDRFKNSSVATRVWCSPEGLESIALYPLPASAARRYDIKQAVWVAEFNLTCIRSLLQPQIRKMVPLPQFPRVERDLALLIPDNLGAGTIVDWIAEFKLQELEEFWVFDRYGGKGIADGFVSLGVRFRFRSAERSLTSDEVDGPLARLVHSLQTKADIRLREGSVL